MSAAWGRFAGLDAAVPGRAMLVSRFDAVPRIPRLVQREEEFLRVAVEAALPRLIRRNLGECVVTAFLAHTQLQSAEGPGERSGAGSMPAALHSDLGKEFIRDPQYVHRRELRSEKMAHENQVPGSLAGRTV